MKITRETCKEIRLVIDAALAEIAEKHGLSMKAGSCSFDPDGRYATFKLEVATLGEGGEVVDRRKAEMVDSWKQVAEWRGFDPEALGRTFTYGREVYTLEGVNLRKVKFPVIAIRKSNGKGFCLPWSAIECFKVKSDKSPFADDHSKGICNGTCPNPLTV